MDYTKELHEMCETLGRALKEANEKLRAAGGKITSADMDYVDRLTHSLKSVKAVIAMNEAEEDDEYSERYSRDGNSYRRGYSRDDGYSRNYDGRSYARGRGTYAKRDSMGRYSSDDGYSMHGDMVENLRMLMQDAPDEQTRQEMQNLIRKMENR